MSWLSPYFDAIAVKLKSAVTSPEFSAGATQVFQTVFAAVLKKLEAGDVAGAQSLLQAAHDDADKLIGAAAANTPAQGLVDASALPPGTPAVPKATVPASPGA